MSAQIAQFVSTIAGMGAFGALVYALYLTNQIIRGIDNPRSKLAANLFPYFLLSAKELNELGKYLRARVLRILLISLVCIFTSIAVFIVGYPHGDLIPQVQKSIQGVNSGTGRD